MCFWLCVLTNTGNSNVYGQKYKLKKQEVSYFHKKQFSDTFNPQRSIQIPKGLDTGSLQEDLGTTPKWQR